MLTNDLLSLGINECKNAQQSRHHHAHQYKLNSEVSLSHYTYVVLKSRGLPFSNVYILRLRNYQMCNGMFGVWEKLERKWSATWQNQQCCMCAQRWLRSAWAFSQSEQSLLSASINVWSFTQRRRWSDWADAQADLRLRWAHRSFCWFCHAMALCIWHKV